MKNNLVSLVVDSLIVHEVPKKFSKKHIKDNPELDEEDIILSEVPTEFDKELVNFFHDRISATIGSNSAFEIEFDPSLAANECQVAINEYFNIGNSSQFPINDSDSIKITQRVTKKLHDVQTAINPGGILLFIPCHNNSKNGIAILKVEREEGVRIQRETNSQGKKTFNAQHIKDLMLTKKTKLFKIVLFYKNNDKIVGYLCDQQQQGLYGNKEVADFFLKDFLGCKLKEEPHVTTKKFFEASSLFINNSSLDDNEKLEVHTHLISELTNNEPSINILDFARRSLPQKRVGEFMNFMSDNKIPPTFNKDIKIIADKIRKVRYEFVCGIKVMGTADVINDNLKIDSQTDGKTKIELIDYIKKVESK